jgi:hypothetical protein
VNVGLFGQQAGLSLDHLLRIAGEFAALRSKNANDKEPYGLDPQTRRFIEAGYKIGETGMFDDSGPP